MCHSATSSCVAPNANPLKKGVSRDASFRLPLSELLGVRGSQIFAWWSGMPRQWHAAVPWFLHGQGQWVHSVNNESRKDPAPSQPGSRQPSEEYHTGCGESLAFCVSLSEFDGLQYFGHPRFVQAKDFETRCASRVCLARPPPPHPPTRPLRRGGRHDLAVNGSSSGARRRRAAPRSSSVSRPITRRCPASLQTS